MIEESSSTSIVPPQDSDEGRFTLKRTTTWLCCLCVFLSACGVRVPPITALASPAETQILVQNIVHSINCEITNSVLDVMGRVGDKQNNLNQSAAFMQDWGALVSLTLQLDETTALSPNGVWLVPSIPANVFTLGVGGSGSSHAQRVEKLSFFYSVSGLRTRNKCNPVTSSMRSQLIRSDLGLAEWLEAEVISVSNLEYGAPTDANSILKQNVLQHEVKFDMLTSANITPAWKWLRGTLNQSGNLFSTNRERLHDLLITFGPIDPAQKNGGLVLTAQNAHLAAQSLSEIILWFGRAFAA